MDCSLRAMNTVSNLKKKKKKKKKKKSARPSFQSVVNLKSPLTVLADSIYNILICFS